jgi:phosphate starvation-inducible protein PhoH and related proteins
MPRKSSNGSRPPRPTQEKGPPRTPQGKDFHIELLNTAQKLAWQAFQQHDVLFLVGPAGSGKTFLATAFAVKSFLAKECSKIIITRPIVEAGESLGFLPGTFEEKVNPYMMPIYDCMDKMLGREGPHREKVIQNTEVAPLAYLRGRTFSDAVCIFDEAQNASMKQLKLFLTRFDGDSKIIITGDPTQSDLQGPCALSEVVRKLSEVVGIGIVEFKNNSIVRHPLVGQIIDKLGE